MSGVDAIDGGADDGKMSFSALFFMGFFWVCGGPYGGEGFLQLAPPGVIFGIYLASQFLHAVPIALINAELAVAIPADGGLVVWVDRAFGSAVGGHNAWWCYVSYCFDACIYPLLAGKYITTAAGIEPESSAERSVSIVIAEGIVVVITFIKLVGNDFLTKFIEVATCVSLGPIAVLVVMGVAKTGVCAERWFMLSDILVDGSGGSGSEVAEGEGIQWALLISWCASATLIIRVIGLFQGYHCSYMHNFDQGDLAQFRVSGSGCISRWGQRPVSIFPLAGGVPLPLCLLGEHCAVLGFSLYLGRPDDVRRGLLFRTCPHIVTVAKF
jgi:amino acid transporter